jgi:hypothetical protein
VEEERKPEPVTESMKAAFPAVVELGFTELTIGIGLLLLGVL